MQFHSDSPLRILAIAPYEAMRSALLRAAEEYPQIILDAYTGDLQEGAEIVRRLPKRNYDAIISRGGTAELIRPETELPIIEIPVSIYDVLRTIKLSENYTEKCAIVGFAGVTDSAHILCNLLRKNIPIQTVMDEQSAENILKSLNEKEVHTVICDMVTHRIARSHGMNAMLITSGESSIRQALQEAMKQAFTFRQIQAENQLMRSIIQQDSRQSLIFNEEKQIVFTCSSDISHNLLSLMKRKIPLIKDGEELFFYHQAGSVQHAITASTFLMRDKKYYLFQDYAEHISLRSNRPGIRAYDTDECNQQFMSSFYSISGSLGELEQRLTPIASGNQPVLIIGEEGTGKEQIARVLYLRSSLKNRPFVLIDGMRVNERGWDYLLESHSTPLSTNGTTIFFQRLEEAPPHRIRELIAVIEDAGLARRLRLIFSCTCKEGVPMNEVFTELSARLAPLTVQLPTLRSRHDEIPALASLYLNNLNIDLSKQISGFDPGALEMMIQYDWPGNYTQFKRVLQELTLNTEGPYISNASVADLLAQERRKHRRTQTVTGSLSISGQTLTDIISCAVRQALEENGGNQSLTARQLGISRTTLWRILSR